MISRGKRKGTVNQLIEEHASPGSGQGKADNAVIVAMPGYFHFHFSISRLPKNQVTQPLAIIKNQVGIDTAVNISIAAQDIKPMAIIIAIHCLTQALGSCIVKSPLIPLY